MTKRLTIFAAAVFLFFGGCKPKAKSITSTQRKEAAALVSEAQFAMSVRDLARAEGLFVQASALCPDTGDFWLELGRVRMRLGNRSAAKSAYQSALGAYEDESAATPPANTGPILRQIYSLALLGRMDDARALLAKAQKTQPDNRDLRGFAETKQLDQLLGSAMFKETAL